MVMTNHQIGYLILTMFAVAVSCAVGDTDHGDTIIDVAFRAQVLVCAPDQEPDGVSRICGELPLAGVDAVIMTPDGEAIWTGETRSGGEVEARLTNIAQFVVVVSGEPFTFEELRTGNIEADPENAPRAGSPAVSYGVNTTTGVVSISGHLVTEYAYTLEQLRSASGRRPAPFSLRAPVTANRAPATAMARVDGEDRKARDHRGE
jgi:hypothetical protein